METVSATCPQEGALYLSKGRLAAAIFLFRKKTVEKGSVNNRDTWLIFTYGASPTGDSVALGTFSRHK